MGLNKDINKTEYKSIKEFLVSIFPTEIAEDNIKGIFLKKMTNSDLILQNKTNETTGKTTHIACTGPSTNFFKEIIGDLVYKSNDFDSNEDSSKKFDVWVPSEFSNPNDDDLFTLEQCAIWVMGKRGGNHIGLSKGSVDSEGFTNFRSHIYIDDLLLFAKVLVNNEIKVYTLLVKKDTVDYSNFPFDLSKSSYVRFYEKQDTSLYISSEYKGINKIFYGSPGSGKSWLVKNSYENEYSKRVTFHENYNSSDFIGYIKPVIESNNEKNEMVYKFMRGPFTEILYKALSDKDNMYTLIIEEISRGNAAAIFGDVFQLLDRDDNGISEYPIYNEEIYNEINNCKFYIDNNEGIYIPNNLSIIATMNNSDQNTFTLDTAFKRRWLFEYVPISFEKHPFKDNLIVGFNISWENFVTTLNKFMLSDYCTDLMITEDKLLGQYFVKESDLGNIDNFCQKILLYLWDDVFKYDRSLIFKNPTSFNELLDEAKESKLKIFVDELFYQFVEVQKETLNAE